MNTDIRLAVSFRGHRKRKRLRLLLGAGSTDYLIDLWIATAMNHPNGILQGMDETDIALEAGWEGEDPHKFVSALMECGFLEKDESGAFVLHDWEDHQGYVVHSDARKERARKAASVRWEGAYATGNATSMPDACPEHAASNAQSETSNAPLPSPSPSPLPDPTPKPTPKPKKTPCQEFGEDSEAYRLAVLMRDVLQANVPTLKAPDLQKWAFEFDRALRNDERMAEARFVAQVIKWACSDSFWRANIQSPGKLREKFDQLTAKMEAEAAKIRASPQQREWVSPAQRRLESNQQAGREAKRLLFGNQTTQEVTHEA